MANSYLTSDLISKTAVSQLKALNSFVNLGYRNYQGMLTKGQYAPGDTINVRLDNFYDVQEGDTVTAEDIVEASLPVTVQPLLSVSIAYKPTDLQRDIVDFSVEFIVPAVRSISAKLNTKLAQFANTQVNYFTGDITATMNSYAAATKVTPLMNVLNMNNYKRTQVTDPFTAQALKESSTLQNSFLPSFNKSITIEGTMGRLGGMEFMQDTSLAPFVSGTHTAAGDITVDGAVTTGNTIVLQGLTSGATIVAGDLFSIEGVYVYDQIKRQATQIQAQFVVLTGGTAGGPGTISITVSPAIVVSGPRKNISTASMPDNAVVNFVTNATAGYTRSLAFTQRGLVLCLPALQPMDSPFSSTAMHDGVSMRVSKTAEVLENKNILRLDLQYAARWIPDQTVFNITKNAFTN